MADEPATTRDEIMRRRSEMTPTDRAIDICTTIHANIEGKKMAIAGLDDTTFDDDYETGDGFAPIPAGWYDAELVKAKDTETGAGDAAVNIQWKITGPKYANRREFQWLNVGHSSEQTRAIAKGKLKKLCKMNGLEGRWPEADEMVGWTAQIEVSYRKDDTGQIRSSVDKIRDPADHTAGGPKDNQPSLYHEAKEQDDGGPAPDDPGTDGPTPDDDMPF